jgi:hypothetical protein
MKNPSTVVKDSFPEGLPFQLACALPLKHVENPFLKSGIGRNETHNFMKIKNMTETLSTIQQDYRKQSPTLLKQNDSLKEINSKSKSNFRNTTLIGMSDQ